MLQCTGTTTTTTLRYVKFTLGIIRAKWQQSSDVIQMRTLILYAKMSNDISNFNVFFVCTSAR